MLDEGSIGGRVRQNSIASRRRTGHGRRDGSQSAGAGIVCETAHVIETRPYEAIIQTAEASHCDLIVMASHGRSGASTLMLGSETQKVLAHTKLPVLVCR